MKSIIVSKSVAVLLSTPAHRFSKCLAGRLLEHLAELSRALLWISASQLLLCLHVTPMNVEMRALRGLYHLLRDSLFFLIVKVVLYTL